MSTASPDLFLLAFDTSQPAESVRQNLLAAALRCRRAIDEAVMELPKAEREPLLRLPDAGQRLWGLALLLASWAISQSSGSDNASNPERRALEELLADIEPRPTWQMLESWQPYLGAFVSAFYQASGPEDLTKAAGLLSDTLLKNRGLEFLASLLTAERLPIIGQLAQRFPLPGEPSQAAKKLAAWLKKLRPGESITAHRRGSGRAHKGRDLFAAVGTPVLALRRGRVLRVVRGSDSERPTQKRAGIFVDVGGEDGDVWRYLHLLQPTVSEGQLIKSGDRIASVGTSGIKHARAHLHLERRAGDYDQARRDYGEPRDPLLGLNLDDDERSLAMDIDWKNTLDKILTVGGPVAAKALDTTYPGAGTALAVGVTLLDEQVVKPYVPGKEDPKPAASPAPSAAAPAPVAAAAKTIPQVASAPAAPSSTFADQAAQFLASTGWSSEEVEQLLRGPQKGDVTAKATAAAAPKSAGTVHHFVTLRKQAGTQRPSQDLAEDDEDETDEGDDETQADRRLALANEPASSKALEHHFVTFKKSKTTG